MNNRTTGEGLLTKNNREKGDNMEGTAMATHIAHKPVPLLIRPLCRKSMA